MIKTKINDTLLNLLKEDETVTLNLKGVIENYDSDIYTNEKMTGLWINDGYFNFLHTKDESFIEEVLDELVDSSFIGLSATHKFVRDYMDENLFIHWKNPCKLLTLESPEFTEEDLIDGVDSLTLEDAEFVNDNYIYKHEGSLKKIIDAIKTRPTSCVRVDGVPVSYVLLHEDNSIGYMYTVKEHRKKGYAYEVTKDIVLKTIKSGRVPYVHIAHWNYQSLALAKKTGFKEIDDVYWFGILNLKGKELQKELKRYKDIYSYNATHLANTLSMKKSFEPLDVAVENLETHIKANYKGKEYILEYIYSDEIYFIKRNDTLTNKLLRSILLKFLPEEEFLCLFHISSDFDKTGFHGL